MITKIKYQFFKLHIRNRMIHKLLDYRTGHVLHDSVVDVTGDDGDSDNVSTVVNNVSNLFVFYSHNILSIDLQQVVVNKQTISCCRGINRN